MRPARARPRYRTTLDRSGWALATGAGGVGVAAALLGWAGGASWPGGLGIGLVGFLLGAVAILCLATPIWRIGRLSGPVAAGLTGAGIGGVLTIVLIASDVSPALPSGLAWASMLTTALIAAFLGVLIGLAMWLVAYRPN